PTNRLVLVSKSGFSKQAEKKARFAGAETYRFKELFGLDIEGLIGPNGALWLKTSQLSPINVRLDVAVPETNEVKEITALPDFAIYDSKGRILFDAGYFALALVNTPAAVEWFLANGKDVHRGFMFGMA